MDKEVAEKEPMKESPSNNMEDKSTKQVPQQPTQAPQPKPDSFTISTAGVDELVQALNEVVASKYVKQVLFNVINEHFKPVFNKK